MMTKKTQDNENDAIIFRHNKEATSAEGEKEDKKGEENEEGNDRCCHLQRKKGEGGKKEGGMKATNKIKTTKKAKRVLVLV